MRNRRCRTRRANRSTSRVRIETLEPRLLMAGDASPVSVVSSASHSVAVASASSVLLGESEATTNVITPSIVGSTSTLQQLTNRYGAGAARAMLESVGRIEVPLPLQGKTIIGSGTVLSIGSGSYVLTAAHVVEDDNGNQFAPSQLKFRTFSAGDTSFPNNAGTVYEVEAIAGRTAFDGRDLALLRLKSSTGLSGIALVSQQPTVGAEIVTSGYGKRFATDVSNQRRAGISHVDGVGQFPGGVSKAGHRFVGEHLKFVFNAGEAATAKGDSGGPDYLIRGGVPTLAGVHSFYTGKNTATGVPSISDTTWSVQLTSDMVSRVQSLVQTETSWLLQIGVRVRNDGDGAFSGAGEWHATLELNGKSYRFVQDVTERVEPYWIEGASIPARTGEGFHVRFWGEEYDDGFFTGGNDTIPLLDETFTVQASASTWTIGGRSGDTAYDLVARTVVGWRRSFADLPTGTPNRNVFDPRAVNGNFTNVVAGDFNADGIDDLLFHDIVTGQNRWAFGRLGGTWDFQPDSILGEKAVNSEFNHVVVGDFNGDRLDDLLFHATASGNNRWFLRRPDGSYDFHHNVLGEKGVNGEFDHLVVGDFNGDGADDLLFHATRSGNNRWAFGAVGGLPTNLEVNLLESTAVNGEFDNVAAGDFDGDGRDDVLFHATNSGNTRWVFGRRDGRFDSYYDVSRPLIGQGGVNHEYDEVAAGDLNGDGRDDLVFFATGSGHTRRAFSNADRTFDLDGEFRIDPAQLVGKQHIALGDFNGDGVDDQFFHAVCSGETTAAFSNRVDTAGGSPWVFVGDFDADGDPDVVRRRPDGGHTMELWGDRQIERTMSIDPIDRGWRIQAVGDFDGDRDDDLLLRHANGGYHVIIVQDGTWPEYRSLGTIDPRWHVAAVGDFDGDGDDDLLMRLPDGGYETKLMQNGVWVERRSLGSIDPVWSVTATGDFDGDGDVDLLMQKTNGESTIKRMQDGVWSDGLSFAGGPGAVAGDFDGDGDDDLLLRHSSAPMIVHLMQDGRSQVAYFLPNLDAAWETITTADFDVNGTADVLFEHPSSGRMWLNIGAEVARARIAATVRATGDFNNDGRADWFSFEPGTGANDVRYAALNGELSPGQHNQVDPLILQGGFDQIASGDFNGDGRNDLMFRNSESGESSWHFAGLDGPFKPDLRLTGPTSIPGDFDHLVAGDFNGDGVDDLLLHATRSGENHWWFGRSKESSGDDLSDRGNVPLPATSPHQAVSNDVVVNRIETTAVNGVFDHVMAGDFDGDGVDDVLFHDTKSGMTRWAFGRKDGGLDAWFDVNDPLIDRNRIDNVFAQIAVGDLDADGRDDVIFYSPTTGHVRVAYGQADRTFRFEPDYDVPRDELLAADHLFASDFNGDGAADLLLEWLPADESKMILGMPPATPPEPSLPDETENDVEEDGNVIALPHPGSQLPNPHTPVVLPEDINGDGDVSPLDALLIINRLNAGGSGRVTAATSRLDANHDGDISPLDALLVINALNSQTRLRTAQGEQSKTVRARLTAKESQWHEQVGMPPWEWPGERSVEFKSRRSDVAWIHDESP